MSYPEQQNRPQVEDPGEFNQRQRLQAIANARNQAREIRLQTEVGAFDADPASSFFTAVQNYAMEIEWLVQKHGGDDYKTTKLGEITVPVPEALQDIEHGQISWDDGFIAKTGRILGETNFRPETLEVVGLVPSNQSRGVAFINLPPTWSETWTITVDVRHTGPETRTFEQTVDIPYTVSLSAFQLCNKFLNDVELDARIKKETDRDPNPY